MPRAAQPVDPLLGPFAAVPALVAEVLARNPWYAEKGLPLPLLCASLAAQWTVAVKVVLADRACQADAGLRTRVLAQAYQGWWHSLGLSTSLAAAWQTTPAKPHPKPQPENLFWNRLLQAMTQQVGQPAALATPHSAPRGLALGNTSLLPPEAEGPKK